MNQAAPATQILIVEDSPTQAYNLKITLESESFQVKVCNSGEEALKFLAEESIDLILTDIIMPGISGYDLCRAIKSDTRIRDIPVILLTTLREEQDIIQGIECGADNFINKPYDPQYLLARIYQVLNVSKRRLSKSGNVEVELMGRSLSVNQNTAQVLDFLVSSFEEYIRSKKLEDLPAEAIDSTSGLAQKAFELSRSQSELRRQTLILQSILTSMVEAVIVADERGNLITLNKAARDIFCNGKQPRSINDLEKLYQADQVTPLPDDKQPYNSAMSGETMDGIELFLPGSGNRLDYWLSCNVSVLKDELGLNKGAVIVFRDVTARKQLEQQVRHFYSMITHELRTPLTAIKGSLRLIEGGLAGDISNKAKDLVTMAVTESDRLIALINDILDITKIESGRLEINVSDLDPTELVRHTVNNMQSLADSASIKIITELNTNGTKVVGDRSRILQVLTNLLGNALKFSPTNSTILIRTLPADSNRLRFEIVDQGPGIAADKLNLLFKPFQQISSTSSHSIGGTGLGLHTCQLLIERQGGAIGVESEIGKGSNFWFELPLAII
ncbi:MAG: response regulator [Candidatus Obscuribacterales bacterium]|nr:response regulator [Candidatus Obscuribacterales bacterium]